MPGQRSHGIDDEQHPGLVQDLRQTFQWLQRAGGSLRMHDAHRLGVRMPLDRFGQHLEREDFTPRDFKPVDPDAGAFHHVDHPGAEDAVDADDRLVAGLHQVRHHALHAGHAGGGDGEGQRVFGFEDLAQLHAGRVHDLDVAGIEVAQRGRSHGAQDAGRDGARAGAHQDAFGDVHESHGFRGSRLAKDCAVSSAKSIA